MMFTYTRPISTVTSIFSPSDALELVAALALRASNTIFFSFVSRLLFFPSSRSLPRRNTIPLLMAWFGFLIITPPVLILPPRSASAACFSRRSFFDGAACRMYADSEFAIDVAVSFSFGARRISPRFTGVMCRSVFVFSLPSPGTRTPAASNPASIAFASFEFNPK